uniref:GHMP kinase N-terminal domain-containing protein n=1 Tax=Acrobeloides nanus TaxID=290746 RepID=A0A914DDI8_9BILA
ADIFQEFAKQFMKWIREVLHGYEISSSILVRITELLEEFSIKIAYKQLPNVCSIHYKFPPKLKPSLVERVNSASVEMACRIDMAGGWTDTPPITYSVNNPAVLNIAVKVDHKKPIGCEVGKLIGFEGIYLISDLGSVLKYHSADEVVRNCSQPSKLGSLMCAIINASGFINEEIEDGVKKHRFDWNLLSDSNARGLMVRFRSDLPHGSGLGTSSILAAAILTALWTLFRRDFTRDDVVKTVLKIEQHHTTGGGWQDQVGGIVEGAKMITLDPSNQEVRWKVLPISAEFREEIERRLVLVYTGKTRLAKDLLQAVILNWLRSDSDILDAFKRLSNDAFEAATLMEQQTFPLKQCVNYHELKKTFASGSEPLFVADLIRCLKERNFVEEAWIAGAGGGGFLYVWLQRNVRVEDLRKFFQLCSAFNQLTVSSIEIDENPLQITTN